MFTFVRYIIFLEEVLRVEAYENNSPPLYIEFNSKHQKYLQILFEYLQVSTTYKFPHVD